MEIMRWPWWFWLAYADVKFWFVTIPTAIALALSSWYGAPWLGGLRWVLIAGVILLALPFPATAAILVFQKIDATRYWRTLAQTETIAGISLPAGSRLRFADKPHSVLVSIELPHTTEVRGMRLMGTLTPWGKWRGVDSVWGGISMPRRPLSIRQVRRR